jgi:hypothetical protein
LPREAPGTSGRKEDAPVPGTPAHDEDRRATVGQDDDRGVARPGSRQHARRRARGHRDGLGDREGVLCEDATHALALDDPRAASRAGHRQMRVARDEPRAAPVAVDEDATSVLPAQQDVVAADGLGLQVLVDHQGVRFVVGQDPEIDERRQIHGALAPDAHVRALDLERATNGSVETQPVRAVVVVEEQTVAARDAVGGSARLARPAPEHPPLAVARRHHAVATVGDEAVADPPARPARDGLDERERGSVSTPELDRIVDLGEQVPRVQDDHPPVGERNRAALRRELPAPVDERQGLRLALDVDEVREHPPVRHALGGRHPARARREGAPEAHAGVPVRLAHLDDALRVARIGDMEPPAVVEGRGSEGALRRPARHEPRRVDDDERRVADREQQAVAAGRDVPRRRGQLETRDAARLEPQHLALPGEEDEGVADLVPLAHRGTGEPHVDGKRQLGQAAKRSARGRFEHADCLGPACCRTGLAQRHHAVRVGRPWREGPEDLDEPERQLPSGPVRQVPRDEELRERCGIVLDGDLLRQSRVDLPLFDVVPLTAHVAHDPEAPAAQTTAQAAVGRVAGEHLELLDEAERTGLPDRVLARAGHRRPSWLGATWPARKSVWPRAHGSAFRPTRKASGTHSCTRGS